MKILVSGSGGQLAEEIRTYDFPGNYHFEFLDEHQMDISDRARVMKQFELNRYDFCINCAAYTAVDAAETHKDTALKVNADGVSHLAMAAAATNTCLIHISTDFVFDGSVPIPRNEEHDTQPINHYGASKLEGEEYIRAILPNHYIIRTSWLYAAHGSNFVSTMLRLGKEREVLSVVADQVGTPTWTKDLVDVIYFLIRDCESIEKGTYHYSNEGVASWYDFAHAIFSLADLNIALFPISSDAYPSDAKRPFYSVMDKSKIREAIKNISIPHWRDSLKQCLKQIQNEKEDNGVER